MSEILVELTGTNKYYAVTDVDGKEYSVAIMYDENTDSESYEVTAPDNEDVPEDKAEELYQAVLESKK